MTREIVIDFDRRNMQIMIAMCLNKFVRDLDDLSDDELLELTLDSITHPYAIKVLTIKKGNSDE